MAVAVATIGLGILCTLLDLGSRLFGSYRRTMLGATWRIIAVVLACAALATPVAMLAVFPTSRFSSLVVYVAAAVGAAECFHFLFPYRWGIRRAEPANLADSFRRIGDGIILREQSLDAEGLGRERGQLTVLVVSDLHCNSRRKLAKIKDAVAQFDDSAIDLVFLLGDFGENPSLLPELIAALAAIPNRHGTFCVRGNHDFEHGRCSLVEEHLERHGIVLLSDRHIRMPQVGVTLIGLECPRRTTSVVQSPPPGFSIGLTHTPDNILKLADNDVDFAFAGHTHGGRLRLPLIGPLLVPCRLGRFLDAGWFVANGMSLYVTPGIGYFPGRHRRPGEFLKVTLRGARRE